MISEPWDVVVVPFPFTEGAVTKRRPALTISTAAFNETGQTVLAMITTKIHAPWPGDTELEEFNAAGLNMPCMVRLKIFTLDNRLIMRKIGRLSPVDRQRAAEQIRRYLHPTP